MKGRRDEKRKNEKKREDGKERCEGSKREREDIKRKGGSDPFFSISEPIDVEVIHQSRARGREMVASHAAPRPFLISPSHIDLDVHTIIPRIILLLILLFFHPNINYFCFSNFLHAAVFERQAK